MGNKIFPSVVFLFQQGSFTTSNPIKDLDACTQTGGLGCIYWGDHLTINDSPSCQIKVRNNGSVSLNLSMTATMNGLSVTWNTNAPNPMTQIGLG